MNPHAFHFVYSLPPRGRWPPLRRLGRSLWLYRQTPAASPHAAHQARSATPRRDYEGRISTLCAGCSRDSISAAIIQACWDLNIEPHRVAKLSGIGCSSKTPDYFLGASHGFNTVHGRMPRCAYWRQSGQPRVVVPGCLG